ncbi:chemotaxis protein CheW [Paucibacter sp. B2R-40]|uniref:chemotaxis protein CheW n=1 Tax=Paucibacter sp. B2R-40 TaxID=2893554 RepID=UPI0021E36060|nr:chemotaxis protein CheW [Paucibacter sp. B2R-40]MCV2354456.1 chemotaxis protein CheW [Paucibacter sp. B2R-40]
MSDQLSQNLSSSRSLAAPNRAPALAQPVAAKIRIEVLSFHLGQEEYGIPLNCVQEIRSFQAPTRLAGASAEVLGVLDLRGEVLPVIDLRRCFHMPSAEVTAATVTIVVNLSHRSVGIVVDNVNEVVDLAPEQQRSMPAMNGMANDGHILGIGSIGARMLLLLDLSRLLDERDLGAATAEDEKAQELDDCLA